MGDGQFTRDSPPAVVYFAAGLASFVSPVGGPSWSSGCPLEEDHRFTGGQSMGEIRVRLAAEGGWVTQFKHPRRRVYSSRFDA